MSFVLLLNYVLCSLILCSINVTTYADDESEYSELFALSFLNTWSVASMCFSMGDIRKCLGQSFDDV